MDSRGVRFFHFFRDVIIPNTRYTTMYLDGLTRARATTSARYTLTNNKLRVMWYVIVPVDRHRYLHYRGNASVTDAADKATEINKGPFPSSPPSP